MKKLNNKLNYYKDILINYNGLTENEAKAFTEFYFFYKKNKSYFQKYNKKFILKLKLKKNNDIYEIPITTCKDEIYTTTIIEILTSFINQNYEIIEITI